MILSGDSILERGLVVPAHPRTRVFGMTYGVGPAGYDIRVEQSIMLRPGDFSLGSTVEEFRMDDDVLAIVHDKSTWARRGLSVFNTVIEPGWRGFLTLELKNQGDSILKIEAGMPIAQVIFHVLDQPASKPYEGKYQDQKRGAQPAILVTDADIIF
jgi:dCTP deaminase